MSIISGDVAKANLIRRATNLSSDDALVYRIIRDRSNFYGDIINGADSYLRVFLAVDDSDPSSVPPKDISAERHEWAKAEFTSLFVRQASFIQDVKDYLVIGSGTVSTGDPVLANLKGLLAGLTRDQIADLAFGILDESVRSNFKIWVHNLMLESARQAPKKYIKLPVVAKMSGSYPFYAYTASATPSPNSSFYLDVTTGYHLKVSDDESVTTEALPADAVNPMWSPAVNMPVNVKRMHLAMTKLVHSLCEHGNNVGDYESLLDVLEEVRDNVPTADTPVVLATIRQVADTIVDLINFANTNNVVHSLDIADFV